MLAQDPNPGVEAPKGSTVTITISEGPETTSVPSVIGQARDAAEQARVDAGFDVDVREQETTDPASEDRVLDQRPRGGGQAAPGSTVTIVVGRLVVPEDTAPDEEDEPGGNEEDGANEQGGANEQNAGNGRGRGNGKGKGKGGR